MHFNRYTWMAAVVGAAAITSLAGCHKDNAVKGMGAANVSIKATPLPAGATVSVTVQGPAESATVTVPLVKKTDTQYVALVSSLPVGSDYTFTASAKDASNKELFHGSVSPVVIAKNQTANVVITMNEVGVTGTTSSAPVIDSLSASSLSVPQAGTVTISASAKDADAGETAAMTWAWTSTCGPTSLSAPVNTVGNDTTDGTSTVVFTAPASNGPCTVNVTVTDAKGVLTNSASLTIQVNSAADKGNASIVANLDNSPVISGITGSPVPLHTGTIVNLAVTATDPDADPLTYLWSSPDCTGTFGTATAASTAFTLTTATTNVCTFAVKVDDGRGGVITSSLKLPVNDPTVSVSGAPVFGYDYQSSNAITADGQMVNFGIVATEGCAGGTISLTWASSDGNANVSSVANLADIGLAAPFTGGAIYTAPAGAVSGNAVVVTVTAHCTIGGQEKSHTDHAFPALTPQQGVCTGKADGTDCTASLGNKCVASATCQSQQCVKQTDVVCPAGNACQTATCVAATGCALVNVDNKPCSDSNACTSNDVCTAGVCGGSTITCPAATAACKVASCDAVAGCGFVNAVDGTTCNDDNACTSPDTCTNGACGGTAVVCPVGDVCNVGSCSTTQGCILTPVTCPAGQVCDVAFNGCHTVSVQIPMCAAPVYANKLVPPLSGLATGPSGTPWEVGQIFNPFDFGAGTVQSSGSADIYMNKVDPATGLATATFTFGDTGGKDQNASGVTVAGNGNVGMIGTFTGEIDFTANDSAAVDPDSGLPLGTAGLDFLQNASAIPFYAVISGASSGTFATPIKSHMVDVGTGALLGVGSNPSQNAIAICGKTSIKVTNWANSGATKGVIFPTNTNSAGGGMDIIVAKIDAATGSVIWGRQFGGAGDQVCESVAIDNNGDVVIGGAYTGTLNFSTTVTLPVVSDTTLGLLYVAKLSSANGTPLAAATWGTSGRSDAFALTTDASNNIVFGGSLGANVDFGGGVSVTNAGLTDAFVAKLTTALAPVWAKSFGDAAYDQVVKTVSTASTGDVYLGGSFKGTMPQLSLTDSSNAALDAFQAHLGADGSVVCASSYGDAPGAQAISFVSVARTATGALADAVFAGGAFSSQIQLGSSLLDTGSAGLAASFVTRLK